MKSAVQMSLKNSLNWKKNDAENVLQKRKSAWLYLGRSEFSSTTSENLSESDEKWD